MSKQTKTITVEIEIEYNDEVFEEDDINWGLIDLSVKMKKTFLGDGLKEIELTDEDAMIGNFYFVND